VPETADQILELLSNSESRWDTLQATGREWRNSRILAEAWQAGSDRKRASAPAGSFQTGRAYSSKPKPEESEERWSLWLAPPRKRAHFTVGADAIDVVVHGPQWWSNGHGESRSNIGSENHGSHGLGWGENFVRTSDFVHLLHFIEVTEGTHIGRPVIDAWAIMRHQERRRGPGLHGLILGDADRVRLIVDGERGVILRTEAWFHESLYRILEMSEVQYDLDFGPEIFHIDPLPGQSWQPPR
jgi:hypothetical protein